MQIKQGLDPEQEELQAELADAQRAADSARGGGGGRAQQVLTLRVWGMLLAVTHRVFGARVGGDAAALVDEWQSSLQSGAQATLRVTLLLDWRLRCCGQHSAGGACTSGSVAKQQAAAAASAVHAHRRVLLACLFLLVGGLLTNWHTPATRAR